MKITYIITYDPNGGVLHGSTEPESSAHEAGEVIRISEAPTRKGYRFLYWKGSEYQPGDSYTVTGDHMFVAQWEEIPGPTDRCYNGGTIINYKIPKTGDSAPLLLWGAGVLAGTAGLFGLAFRRRLRRRKK